MLLSNKYAGHFVFQIGAEMCMLANLFVDGLSGHRAVGQVGCEWEMRYFSVNATDYQYALV